MDKALLPLLFEIDRSPNLVHQGKTIFRQAVRGIIFQNDRLLMVYSLKNQDYKFPGGGIEQGESHHKTLVREILEECGARVTEILGSLGRVIEYDRPMEKEFDLFQMTSHYYICTVHPVFIAQNLDQYEKDLGFVPRWVDLDQAISANHAVLNSPTLPKPKWTARDTAILNLIKQRSGDHQGLSATALLQKNI